MKTHSNIDRLTKISMAILTLLLMWGCQRDLNELQTATNPTNGDIFIDGFSPGLQYASFGGAVPEAFQVDKSVTYNNSAASMSFAVPDVNDPNGAYAGGSFFTSAPRDLSGYNTLSFWIKATQPASIDVVGFGNDFGANKYQVSISGLAVNTNWKKVYIPIPDAAKLTSEKGMFFISEGPENGRGYTFWIDDLKFENVGTIGNPAASIFNGEDKTINSFIGVTNNVENIAATINLPNGVNQTVNATPYYFTFNSSAPTVATVSETGVISTIAAGTAKITASLGKSLGKGSLTINSAGAYLHAPTPTQDPSKVISIFSEKYTNVPVDYYNGYYAPYQTTKSADFIVDNDRVLNYTNFNFVGIQFSKPTIDATTMSHFHMDIYLPQALQAGANFSVQLIDWGNDGVYGGSDDTSATKMYTAPTLQGQKWVSIDIPFSSLSGLASRKHLGQIILSGTNVPGFYADNIYLYNDGSIIPATPTVAAPIPAAVAADVLSIFSDSYTNVAGTDFNPNWGQSTVVSQLPIAGNNTLKYAGLNYQGIQLANPLNTTGMSFLHLDYYSANSTSLNVYLISNGPVEKPYSLTVPTGSGTNGWKSIDIPLSAFSPVDLTKIIQFKFDGNGDVFLDNLYFHK
jgi:hypothetical protein